MRRELVTWSVVLAIILAVFGTAVLVLNFTVYTATGFVTSYLDALQRKDAAAALQLAGGASAVPGGGAAEDALLAAHAMGDLTDIEVVTDHAGDSGVHTVIVEFVAGGMPGTAEFTVQRDGTVFGLFNAWRFSVSPLATLLVTPEHERIFTANGVDLVAEQDVPAPYLVFAPSAVRLEYDSEFIAADPVDVLVPQPGAAVQASVDLQPTSAFVAEVQRQVDEYLTACTTQQVLLPAGCPFGETIVNRIVTAPTWSIAQFPVVSLVPDGRTATWRVPLTPGTAHLVVDVQSIFDGSVSTFDQDVPFTVEYEVIVLENGDPLITAVYQ